MSTAAKIRVLVVDDSAIARRSITQALARDSSIEVVGTASDPYVARDRILALKPDVLTLDLEMPRMDGLTFLKILQEHHPIPVVVISSATQAGSAMAMEALACGAVDVVGKPDGSQALGEVAQQHRQRTQFGVSLCDSRERIRGCGIDCKQQRFTGLPRPRQWNDGTRVRGFQRYLLG